MDFCMKILKNPDYEASNPVEHWTEMEWKQTFDEALMKLNASEELTETEKEELREFKIFRMVIARQMAKEFMENVCMKAA